jgi:hypothetical protein
MRAKPLGDLFDFADKSIMNSVTTLDKLKAEIHSSHVQSFVQGTSDTC